MEPGSSKVSPPTVIEKIVGFFIPPACREEVLGDLRERYRSPAQYLVGAACVVPCVIWSRIRRTTDAVLLLVEWMSIYAMLVFATLCLDRAALLEPWMCLRLAVPPVIIVAAMTLVDVYADPRKRGFDPVMGPGVGLGVAAAFAVKNFPELPAFVFSLGGVAGTLIVATLRVMFPPATERPVVARIPAFWQRLDLVPRRSLIVLSLQAAVFLATLFAVIGFRLFAL